MQLNFLTIIQQIVSEGQVPDSQSPSRLGPGLQSKSPDSQVKKGHANIYINTILSKHLRQRKTFVTM